MKDRNNWPDKNPWLGLKTYDENSRLLGRDQDIWALNEIIRNNIALVIFGKSGIGKSSLIHAGISPSLRKEGKIPVYVRFEHNTDESYVSQIIGLTKNSINTSDRLNASVPNMGLWDFFHRNDFKDANGITVEPVIILDQFEEIFTLADADHKSQTIELFDEMADLLNNVKPDKIIKAEQELKVSLTSEQRDTHHKSLIIRSPEKTHLEYNYGSKFHIVICIREDYLFYLERNTSKIPALKINRYSLHAFSSESAKQVITGPCPYLFDDKQCEDIISKLATADDDGVIEVDPTLLSIYLYKYYNSKGFVNTGNIIEDFYNDETNNISQKSLAYLEDMLITGEGFRQSIPCNDAFSAGVSQSEISSLVNSRIITIEPKRGHDYIEFSHDVLCPIAKDHREKRIIKIEAKRLRRRVIGSTILLIISALLIASFAYLNKRIIEGEKSLKVLQTKNSASKAHYMIAQGDVLNAIKLLINTATYNDNKEEVLPETEFELNEAFDSLNANYACIAILKHTDDVSIAKYSDDGKNIVTASADGICRIWSSKSAELRKKLVNNNSVNSASFSKDNSRVVCGLKDGSIVIWDVNTKTAIETWIGHKSSVNYACFSPDSKYIVSCSSDGSVKLWNSQTAKFISTIVSHEDQAFSAVFSNDGKMIITASSDGSSVIYEMDTHITREIYRSEDTSVEYAEFSTDNSQIAIVTSNSVYIISTISGQIINVLQGHNDIITSASFSPDGTKIVTSSHDKTIKLWDVKSGREEHTYIGHSNIVKDVEFCPDGRHILSTSRDNEARLWNTIITGNENVINTELSTLASVTYSPNGKYIAAISVMGNARIWDSDSLKLICEFSIPEMANSIVFNNHSDKVVIASDCSLIRVYDVISGNQIQSFNGTEDSKYSYALFTHDDNAIIAFSPDNETVKYDIANDLNDMIHTSAYLNCLCQIPETDYYLVSIAGHSSFYIWDETMKKVVNIYKGHTKDICSIRMSHNLNSVISASSDNTAIIWDISSGESVRKLKKHSSQVSYAEFSPSDDYIITLSTDGTAMLWNVYTGEITAIRKSDAPKYSYMFNPKGKQYFIVNDEQIVKYEIHYPLELICGFQELFDNYIFTEEEKNYYSIK